MREISFTKYRKLKQKGISAADAYLHAKKEGLSYTERTKMIISIYLSSYEGMVRISRSAGDAPPRMLDDPTLPSVVRTAISQSRRKRQSK